MTTQGRRVTGLTVAERVHRGLKPPVESKYSLKIRARKIKEEVKNDD